MALDKISEVRRTRSIYVAIFLDSIMFGYKINTINPPKSDSFL